MPRVAVDEAHVQRDDVARCEEGRLAAAPAYSRRRARARARPRAPTPSTFMPKARP